MLPSDAKARKDIPIYSGFIKYFPKTMIAVAKLSMIGNEQHNPGEPLHWDKSKSTDQLDTLIRHLIEVGTLDSDRVPHDVKIAWRACANCENYLDEHPWDEPVDAILAFIASQKSDKQDSKDDHVFGDTFVDQATLPHCICFRHNAGESMYYTYKGPFPDRWRAEEYAKENPQNIGGTVTIHPLNRP